MVVAATAVRVRNAAAVRSAGTSYYTHIYIYIFLGARYACACGGDECVCAVL